MIYKQHNHSHFWIENEILYESYETTRGIRYMKLFDVPGMPDEEKCSEACMKYIDKEYCQPKTQKNTK